MKIGETIIRETIRMRNSRKIWKNSEEVIVREVGCKPCEEEINEHITTHTTQMESTFVLLKQKIK